MSIEGMIVPRTVNKTTVCAASWGSFFGTSTSVKGLQFSDLMRPLDATDKLLGQEEHHPIPRCGNNLGLCCLPY